MPDAKPCTVPGCPNHARASGLCPTHYQRHRRAKAEGVEGKELRAELRAPLRADAPHLVKLLALSVTPETKAQVEAEALERGVPVSEVMREVLEGWAKRRARKD